MSTQRHQRNKFIVFMSACTIITLLMANMVEASNSRPPRNNDISNMADAIKYLQDLDSYYADRARVRFGKRGGSLVQLLKNRLAENNDLTHTPEYPNGEEIF